MTGSDGTFSFPMPAPGTYYLYPDRLSVGLDRVPRSAMPMEIHVGTEPMPEIDIALVRSARISGRIEIQQNPDPFGVLLDGPPQVVLELTDAVGRHRFLSDRNGHFSFKEVHPGPLTVRVVHAKLPAYYYLEQDIYTFDVTPGGQQHVLIRVLPERRQIRMIDGAPRRRQNSPAAEDSLVVEEPAVTEKPPAAEDSLVVEEPAAMVKAAQPDSIDTAPETEAPAPPEQAPPEPTRFDREKVSWTVVVASRTERASAETVALRYREQLRHTGRLVEVIEGARNGVPYYRVAVGQFETLAAARTVLEELAAEIPEDAWLLRVQPGQ